MIAVRTGSLHCASKLLLSAAFAVMIAACTVSEPLGPARQASAPLEQPANVGDAKLAATSYHSSGAYARDLEKVAANASAWIAQRASQVVRPALVLDVDDTVLSNWEVIVADDFGRIIDGPCDLLPGPCGWAAWDQLGRDPAIMPSLELFRDARNRGVAVFFVTGRPESQHAATEGNLRRVGFTGYERLVMVPDGRRFASAADFKGPVRAGIEREGYSIIANMGDQPSDLADGHAERSFLLPNPFYRVP